MARVILGLDIGGSGIKGAPVDVRQGIMLTERYRIPTPEGAKPADVADAVADIGNRAQDPSSQAGRVGNVKSTVLKTTRIAGRFAEHDFVRTPEYKKTERER